MAQYLVTGGAGFIGSHIVDALVAAGEDVRVLDNLSTGHLKNLAHVLHRIDFVCGDIRDAQAVRSAMRGVDFVFHEAALPSVPRSIADPFTTHDVNATGTLQVLVAARDAQVKGFVFASSSSVYGNSAVLPKREDMCPQPLSPYAVSKLAGEAYCRVFHSVYGLPAAVLRYFNVFGPRQDPDSPYSAVIPKFTRALLNDETVTIYGDGSQSRDFTFVANVVRANLLACGKPTAAGQVMNVACGEEHTLLELHRELSSLLGRRCDISFGQPRPGDVQRSLAAIDRACGLVGYVPAISWREGLRQTFLWHVNSVEVARAAARGYQQIHVEQDLTSLR